MLNSLEPFKTVREDKLIMITLLLSSLTALSIELSARRTFGGGALDTATFDIGNLFIINPESLDRVIRKEILNLSPKILNCTYSDYETQYKREDFIQLDELMCRVLGLHENGALKKGEGNYNPRTDLYNSIIHLIQQRLRKARSFQG